MPRFRLRTLLFVVALIAGLLALYGIRTRQVRDQRAILDDLEQRGCLALYLTPTDDPNTYLVDYEPPGPKWLRDFLGDQYFAESMGIEIIEDFGKPIVFAHDVKMVSLGETYDDIKTIRDIWGLSFVELGSGVYQPLVDRLKEELPDCDFYPSSSNDLLSSIHAALDDGDERIQRIQQASKRREYSAMFHDYDTLRASYIDVVSQITTNQLTDESLAPILQRLCEWEQFIDGFRVVKTQLDDLAAEPLPVDSNDGRITAKEFDTLSNQLEISPDDQERQKQDWARHEARLDQAIASVKTLRSALGDGGR